MAKSKKPNRGGARKGAGRPGNFGDQKTSTIPVRAPVTHIPDLAEMLRAELKKDKYQTPKQP